MDNMRRPSGAGRHNKRAPFSPRRALLTVLCSAAAGCGSSDGEPPWVCDTKAECADPPAETASHARLDQEDVLVTFDVKTQAYRKTCLDAVVLEQRSGDDWRRPVDDRPPTGPYYVDLAYQTASASDDGCDSVSCVPLQQERLSRVQYVQVGTIAQPAGSDEDELPSLTARLVSEPLRVTATYFDDENCRGPEHTLTIPVDPHVLPRPRPTLIRVVNESGEVRSRFEPCAGSYQIGVVFPGGRVAASSPHCEPNLCEADGPVPPPDALSGCPVPTCLDGRLDLLDGEEDVAFEWNGIVRGATDAQCMESLTVTYGAPMVALVCFGKPGTDSLQIEDYQCDQVQFAYGEPEVIVTLK